eukprot:TRINITY_DN37859_c0_g1_i1.p1 TRINITY_DN37859_c0_g1~~TRINITY_DN37859_c0_g1_i1.p1  ORF type:complete len:255 (-),score=50.33 TRINITY_DN37859_c0_g1_i1:128-892(-)
MAYRTDDRARRVTLCKRKKGLYKKALELSTIDNLNVAVVIVGDGCKPAQIVCSPFGKHTEVGACYKVLRQYNDQNKQLPVRPGATSIEDVRELMEKRERVLERQRREIEDLRRMVAEGEPEMSCQTSVESVERPAAVLPPPHAHSISQGSDRCHQMETLEEVKICPGMEYEGMPIVGAHDALNWEMTEMVRTFSNGTANMNMLGYPDLSPSISDMSPVEFQAADLTGFADDDSFSSIANSCDCLLYTSPSPRDS